MRIPSDNSTTLKSCAGRKKGAFISTRAEDVPRYVAERDVRAQSAQNHSPALRGARGVDRIAREDRGGVRKSGVCLNAWPRHRQLVIDA